MKISEIEDADKLASKDDLRVLSAELREAFAALKFDLLREITQSERGQRTWIWGLYGLLIVSQGGLYGLLISWIAKHP
jgi:hypothetical protein